MCQTMFSEQDSYVLFCKLVASVWGRVQWLLSNFTKAFKPMEARCDGSDSSSAQGTEGSSGSSSSSSSWLRFPWWSRGLSVSSQSPPSASTTNQDFVQDLVDKGVKAGDMCDEMLKQDLEDVLNKPTSPRTDHSRRTLVWDKHKACKETSKALFYVLRQYYDAYQGPSTAGPSEQRTEASMAYDFKKKKFEVKGGRSSTN
jgi:hypothetical protein